MMPNAPSRTIRSTRCLSLLLSGALMSCDSGKAPEPPALFTWTDGRTIDSTNRFPNVAASIVDVGPNDAGIPVGILGYCTATLIRDRVLLTAGHCVGAALDGAPGGARVVGAEALPPFIHVYVSFSPTALDRSTWIPVVRFAGHPVTASLPQQTVQLGSIRSPGTRIERCRPPLSCRAGARSGPSAARTGRCAHDTACDARAHDHRRIRVARAHAGRETRWRMGRASARAPETPRAGGRRHVGNVVHPAELCDGDSGGPIFMGNPDRPESLEIVATVSYEGQCRATSIHPRLDNASVQQWIRQTIDAHVQTR
jgi:hypothetical protein